MSQLLLLLILTGSVFFLPVSLFVQVPHMPVPIKEPLQDKTFYFLSILERDPEIARRLAGDQVLRSIAESKKKAITNSAKVCSGSPECKVAGAIFTSTEVELAGKRLQEIYAEDRALQTLVDVSLRRTGMFELYQHKSGVDLLAQIWIDSSQGVNQILETYGEGVPPRYPKIDSASLDVNSPTYSQTVQSVARTVQSQASPLFFQPSLEVALAVLKANKRDEAGRFEPLEKGENAAALRHIPDITWAKYKYSVIVVPGEGPEDPSTPLSELGKARLALAVARYRAGLAPLILVSGGYVHPEQTKFCEAIEMKKTLIADFGIPADVILVDPQARHTTTNIRNAARMIYRYGIPFDEPALITTDINQSKYIESSGFAERNREEIGYLPFATISRVNPNDLTFTPNIDSLQVNTKDVLDP